MYWTASQRDGWHYHDVNYSRSLHICNTIGYVHIKFIAKSSFDSAEVTTYYFYVTAFVVLYKLSYFQDASCRGGEGIEVYRTPCKIFNHHAFYIFSLQGLIKPPPCGPVRVSGHNYIVFAIKCIKPCMFYLKIKKIFCVRGHISSTTNNNIYLPNIAKHYEGGI